MPTLDLIEGLDAAGNVHLNGRAFKQPQRRASDLGSAAGRVHSQNARQRRHTLHHWVINRFGDGPLQPDPILQYRREPAKEG